MSDEWCELCLKKNRRSCSMAGCDKNSDEDSIISICTAYEQGYGMGLELRELSNPYKDKSSENIAWKYGYSEGARKTNA